MGCTSLQKLSFFNRNHDFSIECHRLRAPSQHDFQGYFSEIACGLQDAEADWGGFHVLFHGFYRSGADSCCGQPCEAALCENTTVAAHAYSADGHTWHWSDTAPYPATSRLVGGGTFRVATRERPKPFFDDGNGHMTHLLTAVVDVVL